MSLSDSIKNSIRSCFYEKVKVWRINRVKPAKPEPMSTSPTSDLLTKRQVKGLTNWVKMQGSVPLILSSHPDILSQEVGVILTNIHIADSVEASHDYAHPAWADKAIAKIEKRRQMKLKVLKALASSLVDVERQHGEIKELD